MDGRSDEPEAIWWCLVAAAVVVLGWAVVVVGGCAVWSLAQ